MDLRRLAAAVVAAAVMACLATACAAQAPALGANLVPNPSFEEARGDRPAGWRTQAFGGEPQFSYAEIGRTGKRSLLIASDADCDAAWRVVVEIAPYTKYRISAWIKTENVVKNDGAGACLRVQHREEIAPPALTGTNDWTQVSAEFDAQATDAIEIILMLGYYGTAKGKVWFDDVELAPISASAALKPSAAIDAARTGAPISKYIYGQFIEHLGRCIEGGIWAEMVLDRKFYREVGKDRSPWKPIAGDGAVRMVREGRYVGEHTPQISLDGAPPSGIVQSEFGLLKDMGYTGRIVLAGDPEAAPIKVSLVWGDGPRDRETVTIQTIGGKFEKFPLEFTSKAATDSARLEIVGLGKGKFRVGAVSLMPTNNVNGFRADTLALLKELDAPVYRWPGGNFVSGYYWRDGIGDRDLRAPRENPAWGGVEPNDVGIDEFIDLCRLLNAEPYIAVNAGLGKSLQAAAEVQYCNGTPDSRMGLWRTFYGHPEPFNVKWWGIGNEMYGGWQLGNIPLADYVKRHNEFAEEMRGIDPSIKLVAVGSPGEWDNEMFKNCAEDMDLISEHLYCGQRPGLIAHTSQIRDAIKRICDSNRECRRTIPALKDKDIRIAMDEWNYWYGPTPYGQLGVRYFLKDGLGIAAGLHEFFRNSDIVFMANYAQTVNVIGAIKTSKTAAEFETTGLVLKLYRHKFGTIPVAIEGDVRPLDVSAAWTPDRKKLTVAVVNPTKAKVEFPIEFRGARLAGTGRCYLIAGTDPMAYNEPGKPRRVDIVEKPVKGISNVLVIEPLSVSLFALDTK